MTMLLAMFKYNLINENERLNRQESKIQKSALLLCIRYGSSLWLNFPIPVIGISLT